MVLEQGHIGYHVACKRCFRALRFGPLAVELKAYSATYCIVLLPGGAVADIEDFGHDGDGLYLLVTNYGAGCHLQELEEIDTAELASKLRMEYSDASAIAHWLNDVVKEGHGA